jgi:hypothetical protein
MARATRYVVVAVIHIGLQHNLPGRHGDNFRVLRQVAGSNRRRPALT